MTDFDSKSSSREGGRASSDKTREDKAIRTFESEVLRDDRQLSESLITKVARTISEESYPDFVKSRAGEYLVSQLRRFSYNVDRAVFEIPNLILDLYTRINNLSAADDERSFIEEKREFLSEVLGGMGLSPKPKLFRRVSQLQDRIHDFTKKYFEQANARDRASCIEFYEREVQGFLCDLNTELNSRKNVFKVIGNLLNLLEKSAERVIEEFPEIAENEEEFSRHYLSSVQECKFLFEKAKVIYADISLYFEPDSAVALLRDICDIIHRDLHNFRKELFENGYFADVDGNADIRIIGQAPHDEREIACVCKETSEYCIEIYLLATDVLAEEEQKQLLDILYSDIQNFTSRFGPQNIFLELVEDKIKLNFHKSFVNLDGVESALIDAGSDIEVGASEEGVSDLYDNLLQGDFEDEDVDYEHEDEYEDDNEFENDEPTYQRYEGYSRKSAVIRNRLSENQSVFIELISSYSERLSQEEVDNTLGLLFPLIVNMENPKILLDRLDYPVLAINNFCDFRLRSAGSKDRQNYFELHGLERVQERLIGEVLSLPKISSPIVERGEYRLAIAADYLESGILTDLLSTDCSLDINLSSKANEFAYTLLIVNDILAQKYMTTEDVLDFKNNHEALYSQYLEFRRLYIDDVVKGVRKILEKLVEVKEDGLRPVRISISNDDANDGLVGERKVATVLNYEICFNNGVRLTLQYTEISDIADGRSFRQL